MSSNLHYTHTGQRGRVGGNVCGPRARSRSPPADLEHDVRDARHQRQQRLERASLQPRHQLRRAGLPAVVVEQHLDPLTVITDRDHDGTVQFVSRVHDERISPVTTLVTSFASTTGRGTFYLRTPFMGTMQNSIPGSYGARGIDTVGPHIDSYMTHQEALRQQTQGGMEFTDCQNPDATDGYVVGPNEKVSRPPPRPAAPAPGGQAAASACAPRTPCACSAVVTQASRRQSLP